MSTHRAAGFLIHLALLSLLTHTSALEAQQRETRNPEIPLGESFSRFLERVNREERPEEQERLVAQFTERLSRYGKAIVEDTTVFFVYVGPARSVSVISDLNGWSRTADTMSRLGRTQLFFLGKPVPSAARIEYKFLVDSSWVLDPFNTQSAMGGFGPNSEIRMPGYRPATELFRQNSVPHGKTDTLMFASTILQRTHPVMIYLPPGYATTSRTYPVIVVNDGGEYLSLTFMNNAIDNLLADGRISPLIAVFVDPRTDPRVSSTSKRMTDYSLNERYVEFLTEELRPYLLKHFRITDDPASTAIMGCSLGGLISTYAAYRRPDIFGAVAAQSPAYWMQKAAILDTLQGGSRRQVRFYIDTGTIHDAQEYASRAKEILERKGYEVSYAEYPEGHNWTNWRARIPNILLWFRGTKQ